MSRYVDDVALDSPPKNEKATWDELPFEKDEIQHLHPTKSCRHLGVEIYEKQLTDTLYMIIYSQCKYVEKVVNDFFTDEALLRDRKPRYRRTPAAVTEITKGRQPMYEVPEDHRVA